MYLIERKEGHAWKREPISFERLDDAEKYAEKLYKEGKTARVVDEKGKLHKEADTPRYKALGNSICLPYWEWLARRIAAQYERPMTIGSLFDGIGGFPLAFKKAGAIPVWASEIEPFCIAVTKKRFGDE